MLKRPCRNQCRHLKSDPAPSCWILVLQVVSLSGFERRGPPTSSQRCPRRLRRILRLSALLKQATAASCLADGPGFRVHIMASFLVIKTESCGQLGGRHVLGSATLLGWTTPTSTVSGRLIEIARFDLTRTQSLVEAPPGMEAREL
jgi:hypothetical protein